MHRNNCPYNKLLLEKDLKRINAKTYGLFENSIINKSYECILWKVYINHNKIDYINFFFNGKKYALHRLLYINFKGHLNDNDYLEYTCINKGRCCNINHIEKKKNNNKNKNININSPIYNIVYFD